MAIPEETFTSECYVDVGCTINRNGEPYVVEICREYIDDAIYRAARADMKSGLLRPGGVRRYTYSVVVRKSELPPIATMDLWQSQSSVRAK